MILNRHNWEFLPSQAIMFTADAKLLVKFCSVAHFDELMEMDTPTERVHLPRLARQMVVKTGLTDRKVLLRNDSTIAACLIEHALHRATSHLADQ